jgi:hypothetical protein
VQKKKSIEANQEKIILDFFKKYKLSGIFRLPKVGTFTYFSSEADKLLVLEHAKIELKLKKLQLDEEALNKFLKKIEPSKDPETNRSYLG